MGDFDLWGGLLLLLCGGGIGLVWVQTERRRCRQAEGFLRLLQYVRAQIDCFSAPVHRILAECDRDLLAACGVKEPTADLPALVGTAGLCLSPDICRLLDEFAARLGTGYRKEQLQCCDYYIDQMRPYCQKLRADLPKKERVALVLPIAAAAMLVLLFL